jgi:hypothetical protein
MAFDYEVAAPLVAALQSAQTALTAAVNDGPEHYEAQGGALYSGARPATQAAATMKTAVDGLAAYIETLAPE